MGAAMISLIPLALLLALQTVPLPSADDVRQAVQDGLAARCGDDDACIARQPEAEVRNVACRAAGEGMAVCRYESRAGATAWRAAETRFRFDVETGFWLADDGEGELG